METKNVVRLIRQWAMKNNLQPPNLRYMSKREWGIAKRLANLYESNAQFKCATYTVSARGGFKWGFFTPYSYTLYKNFKKMMEQLNAERPDKQSKR